MEVSEKIDRILCFLKCCSRFSAFFLGINFVLPFGTLKKADLRKTICQSLYIDWERAASC